MSKKMLSCVMGFVVLISACSAYAKCGKCAKDAKKTPQHKFIAGNGLSNATDAKEAGAEAATLAKGSLGHHNAKIVIVFAGRKQTSPEMIEGIATVFPKELIYGCEGYGPVTQAGNLNDNGVAVIALGGEVNITAAAIAGEGKGKERYLNCGKALGEALKDAAAKESKGKVLLTFGDQHVGDNKHFANGLKEVLGEKFPIIGAAAGNAGNKEIVKGEIVKGTNVGILMSGDFELGLAREGGKGGEGFIKASGDAFQRAVGKNKDNLVMSFVFDCGGRRGAMKKVEDGLQKEMDNMRAPSGNALIFGFYGGGEIGPVDNDSPSEGVGYNISVGSIFVK